MKAISQPSELELIDLEPPPSDFLEAVLRGLSQTPKTLPTAFLYDARGSELFDRICELPEYYPTRTEIQILADRLDEIVEAIGEEVELIEYGSGSSLKTRTLLAALRDPVAYVPVDISREHLLRSAQALAEQLPELEILPVCADFTHPFEVPTPSRQPRRRVLYFPGSTIGNFRPAAAVRLIRQMAEEVGPGGGIVLGVDLVKPAEVLERAYDDAQGVTAEFNLNLLARINRELGADFDLTAFEHRAPWIPSRNAVEMRLVSRAPQRVTIAGEQFFFQPGEWIHTEDSHKYTLEGFAAMAARAGTSVDRVWTDDDRLFSIQSLRVQ